MLELFPEGFAEEPAGRQVELVAFTDEAGAGRLRESFGRVASVAVAPGWEEAWKRFHVPVASGPSGSARRGSARSRAWRRRDRSRPRVRHRGASDDAALPRAPAELEPGSLLDVGCGSGVLAIAAAKLGFGPVVAIDSDPVAVEATSAERRGERRRSRRRHAGRAHRSAARRGHRAREHRSADACGARAAARRRQARDVRVLRRRSARHSRAFAAPSEGRGTTGRPISSTRE